MSIMFSNALCFCKRFNRNVTNLIRVKHFFSESFNLNEVWNDRLKVPIISKVNLESLYYDLDSEYSKTRKICPIDVDIFLNGLKDDTYIVEAEELVYRLRTTSETDKTLPTTHHAVIRLFLNSDKIGDLIRILDDRVNYGIFPDHYCSLYLMNYFLKNKDYKNAAKIASLQMFQEDFSDPIVNWFSLFSVHKYILNPSPWEMQQVEESPPDDDDEEVKVRVQFLRRPYFDDHFDLRDSNHICGKTLYLIGKTFDNAQGRTYCALGLALYNKWEKLDEYLTSLLRVNHDQLVYKDSIPTIEGIVSEKLTTNDALLTSVKDKLNQIKNVNNKEEVLIDVVEEELKRIARENEVTLVQKQKEVYQDWELHRNDELARHLYNLKKHNMLQEIETKKDELFKREQLLYYFDNEDKIEMIVKRKSEYMKKRAEGEANRKGSAKDVEEDYIPPEVVKRGFSNA